MPNAFMPSSTCKKTNTERFLNSNHSQGSRRLKKRKVIKIIFFNFSKFCRSFTKLPRGGIMLFSNLFFLFSLDMVMCFSLSKSVLWLRFCLATLRCVSLQHKCCPICFAFILDIKKTPICLLNTTLFLYKSDKLCWCPTFETMFQEAR